jgi:hypothetical protein
MPYRPIMGGGCTACNSTSQTTPRCALGFTYQVLPPTQSLCKGWTAKHPATPYTHTAATAMEHTSPVDAQGRCSMQLGIAAPADTHRLLAIPAACNLHQGSRHQPPQPPMRCSCSAYSFSSIFSLLLPDHFLLLQCVHTASYLHRPAEVKGRSCSVHE